MPNVFIVNVFANASYPFVNPLFQDGTFEVIPIRETDHVKGKWIKRYAELKCFNSDDPLTRHLQTKYHNDFVHNDPDLVNMTYGDVMNGRSGLLDKVANEDWVAFYALLTPIRNQRPVKKERAFYVVSAFEVKEIIRELPALKGNAETRRNFVLKKYGRRLGHRILENAHSRRWLESPSLNNTMRMIIVGGPRSKRFVRPIPLTPALCDECFTDKGGTSWKWDKTKTDLQTIGSYLRSVRIAKHPDKLIKLFSRPPQLNSPRLYSYIVAHDNGFAPCVTDGLLSLACCKPKIRSTARPGDWVMGTTPKKKGSGKLVFLARADEKISFAEYYRRFSKDTKKREDLIYEPSRNRGYRQIPNPHHGPKHMTKDVSTDSVLLSIDFIYYGSGAVPIPSEFNTLVAVTQGHRKIADSKLLNSFLIWARRKPWGIRGKPGNVAGNAAQSFVGNVTVRSVPTYGCRKV